MDSNDFTVWTRRFVLMSVMGVVRGDKDEMQSVGDYVHDWLVAVYGQK